MAVPYCIKCGNLVWFWDVTGARPHEERVNISFSRKMVATGVLALEEERISGKSTLALLLCYYY